jgi:hypothetical protein
MFGIRWQQAKRNGEMEVKEKFFNTEKSRDKFMDRLVEKASFVAILATCDN